MTQDEEIRRTLQQLDAATPRHTLPSSAEAWSRLQFRLAYQPRKSKSTPDASTLLAALYVLAFLLCTTGQWTTSPGWLSAGLLTVIAATLAASLFLVLRASRSPNN